MKISNNRKRKKLLVWAVVTLTLAAVICTCPFPIRIHSTMAGYYVDAQRQTAKPVEVNVTGWYLRYLFFTDDLRVKFDLPDHPENLYVETSDTDQRGDFDGLVADITYFKSDENKPGDASVYFDKPFKTCVLMFHELDYYVLSADPEADLDGFCEKVWYRMPWNPSPYILNT